MKIRLLALLWLALSLQLAWAAPVIPDWIKSSLEIDLGDWEKRPAVIVSDSLLVQFSALDRGVKTRRQVLRIGSAAGFGAAQKAQSYNPGIEKILNATAWLIGKDGKVQKRYKRSDFTETFASYGDVNWDNKRILFLDLSSQVNQGSYVAFEFETEFNTPCFTVRHEIMSILPLAGGTLEVIPPPSIALEWLSTLSPCLAPTPGSAPGSLRWTIDRTDKSDDNPPRDGLLPMRAILARCVCPGSFEMDTTSWTTLATAISKVFAPATQPDADVRAKATELTAGKSDRWSRIRAICEFVQRDIRYIQITLDADYLAGIRPHLAAEVLKNRYGDCKDKAALTISLLETIGESAHMIVVNSGNPLAVVESWPCPSWFNHAIVGIPVDANTPPEWPISNTSALGRLVIFDPTDSISPLGILPPNDQGGFAIATSDKNGGLFRLPLDTPAQNAKTRHIEASLDRALRLKINLTTIHAGTGGSKNYRHRISRGDVEFGRALEAELHQSFAQVDGFKWTDSWGSVTSRHRVEQRFTTLNYGKRLGRDRLLVQPRILAPEYVLPRLESIVGCIDFRAWQVDETCTLKLSSGCTVADLPKPAKADKKFLSWDIAYTNQNNALLFTAHFRCKAVFADLRTYEQIRSEYQELNELLRRPAIITLVPASVKAVPLDSP